MRRAVTVILVTLAVVILAFVCIREWNTRQAELTPKPVVLSDSLWQLAVKLPAAPTRKRKVQIVEFVDYQCSFCREIQPALDSVRARYTDKVVVVRRHLPLAYHENAHKAAVAVECGAAQHFDDAIAAQLFKNQSGLDLEPDWDLLAAMIGVPDLVAFSECIRSEWPAQKIAADKTLAAALGVSFLPTLIVNGIMYSGMLSELELDEAVKLALSDSP